MFSLLPPLLGVCFCVFVCLCVCFQIYAIVSGSGLCVIWGVWFRCWGFRFRWVDSDMMKHDLWCVIQVFKCMICDMWFGSLGVWSCACLLANRCNFVKFSCTLCTAFQKGAQTQREASSVGCKLLSTWHPLLHNVLKACSCEVQVMILRAVLLSVWHLLVQCRTFKKLQEIQQKSTFRVKLDLQGRIHHISWSPCTLGMAQSISLDMCGIFRYQRDPSASEKIDE